MRIASFTNASAHSFLAVPVQALTPSLTVFKNFLREIPIASTAQRVAHKAQQFFTPDAVTVTTPLVFKNASKAQLPLDITTCTAIRASSLRVVREFDSAISPQCAGRMVISGRMADVCAELDRMALRAAAPNAAGSLP